MKKILSLFLSLALFIGAMPIFALADDGFSISEDLTALSGIEEKLQDPDQNLAYGLGLSTVKGTAGTVTLSYTDANNTDKAFTLTRFPNLTNGVIDENHTDVNTSTTDGNAPLYVDADGNALEGVWLDITVSFVKTASIDSLLVAGCAAGQAHFNNQEYEVYAGNSVDSLYSAENKKLTYVNSTSSNGQYIEFDAPVSAQFVGIRITKAVIPEGVPESVRQYAVPRLREIAVFGEITYSEEELVDSAKRAQEYIAKLKTDAHINYGYKKAEGKAKGVMYSKGCEEGEDMSYGSIKSYTTENDLADGDVSTHADVNIYSPNGYIQFLKDGAFRENTYGDIIVCLKNPTVVDSILIGQRVDNIQLRSRKYDLYMSENLSDLFDDENRYAEYENKVGSVQQTFSFPEGVEASFVGMRVYEAVTLPEYKLGDANSYIRLNEFAVFGREKRNEVSVSATSTPIEVINEEETVIEGTTVSYEIPLVKDGYTFSKCLANGEEIETEIIPRSNKARLDIDIDVDTEIVFEYIPNSAQLSGDTFKIIDNRVIVGIKKILVYELIGSFDQYAPSISVDFEGEKASDSFTVTGDMKLNYEEAPGLVKSYDIDLIGDPTNDGEISVSDIVFAADTALSGEADILCDMDENGKVTVSDVISLRNVVINPEERLDYSEKTETVKEMDVKTFGRIAETSTSLLLDLPSTGVAINLDCFGNVYANLKIYGSEQKFITVVIDGEEKEVITDISGAGKVLIAENLDRGEHQIELFKNSGQPITVDGFTFSGTALDAPEEKERYIEFIGDSITEGGGNMLDAGGTSIDGIRTKNEYMSYAAQAARMLDADWSNFCRGGAYLVERDEATTATHIPSVYAQQTINSTDPYSFERKPDIVVINLGTNDLGELNKKYSSEADRKAAFKTAIREFTELVLEKNGEDVHIVYAFGLMTIKNYADATYEEVAAELSAEGYSAHFVRLPTNKDGGGGHPDIAGAKTGAEVLANYIEENIYN